MAPFKVVPSMARPFEEASSSTESSCMDLVEVQLASTVAIELPILASSTAIIDCASRRVDLVSPLVPLHRD